MIDPAPRQGQAAGAELSDSRASSEPAQLLQRLRRGDRAAFDQVAERYGTRLFAVALRMLRNPDDACDALQDALLSAFLSIENFQGDAQLSTWLHRIVVNACLMQMRRRRRKSEISVDALGDFSPDPLRSGAGIVWGLPSEAHDSALQRAQVRRQLYDGLARLPERYRKILHLRDLQELDTQEAARRLRISPTAVKLRLYRARRALRRQLVGDRGIQATVDRQRGAPDRSSAISRPIREAGTSVCFRSEGRERGRRGPAG